MLIMVEIERIDRKSIDFCKVGRDGQLLYGLDGKFTYTEIGVILGKLYQTLELVVFAK